MKALASIKTKGLYTTLSYSYYMRSITIRLQDLFWKEIENAIKDEHSTITEFVHSALRKKVINIRRQKYAGWDKKFKESGKNINDFKIDKKKEEGS